MGPQSSSPTSLLWAHQLKREHAYLLEKLQALEATNARNEDRLKAADHVAAELQSNDFAALANRVKALDEAGLSKRVAKLEGSVQHESKDVRAELEALMKKISALEKDEMGAVEEKRKFFIEEKTLLKRVGEMETQIKKYEAELQEARQEVRKEAYEGEMDDVKQTFEALTRYVAGQRREVEEVAKKVVVLEGENERLGERVAGLEGRGVGAAVEDVPEPACVEEKRATPNPASRCLPCKAKHIKCDTNQPSCNNCVTSRAVCRRDGATVLRKADRQGLKQSPLNLRKSGRVDRKVVPAPAQKQPMPVATQEEHSIICAGRGLVEVVRTPSADPGHGPLPSRSYKPARRKAEKSCKNATEMQAQAGPPLKKRKIEVEPNTYTQRVTRSQAVAVSKPATTAASKTTGEMPKTAPEKEEKRAPKKPPQKSQTKLSEKTPQEAPKSKVFSSPLPSSSKTRKRLAGDGGTLLQQDAHHTENIPVPVRRRRIFQEDESALIWQYGQ